MMYVYFYEYQYWFFTMSTQNVNKIKYNVIYDMTWYDIWYMIYDIWYMIHDIWYDIWWYDDII